MTKRTRSQRRERVTRVIDGDTFQMAARTRSVRLANVDAPERGTRGGAKATNALRKLVKGQLVTVDTVARDKCGRAVAKVTVDGKSVNAEMRRRTKRR